MNALVTGAEGFIGRHLVQALLDRGARVTATRLEPRAADPPDGPSPEWRVLDVLDVAATRSAVEAAHPDTLFHLAGFSSGGKARARAGEALRTNAEGTLNVIESVAAAAPGCRVIVPGSAHVYGDPGPDPVGEDAPVAPGSAYGVSKAAQELVALTLGAARRVDVRVARLFPLIGPGQADAFVVPSFCRQAAEIASGRASPALDVGNLDVERDFVHVLDGVAALLAIATPDRPSYRTYNVCSGVGTSIRTVLSWVLAEAGIDPEIRVDPDRVRGDDPPRIVGSAERLQEAAGWTCSRDVREGVRDTYSWVAAVDPAPLKRGAERG